MLETCAERHILWEMRQVWVPEGLDGRRREGTIELLRAGRQAFQIYETAVVMPRSATGQAFVAWR